MRAQTAGGLPPGMAQPGMDAGQGPRMGAGSSLGGGGSVGNQTAVNRYRFYTENTTLLVTTLVDFSRANSLRINILNIRPPSLEDAFVRLTEEKKREK